MTRRAKLLTDTVTPDFLYTVVRVEGGRVLLGWNGRRGFWNECWHPESAVQFVDASPNGGTEP